MGGLSGTPIFNFYMRVYLLSAVAISFFYLSVVGQDSTESWRGKKKNDKKMRFISAWLHGMDLEQEMESILRYNIT
jgi:hypothetical protein